MVDEAAITSFFAAEPEAIRWPYPLYETWRESGDGSGVVRWESGPATLVTRYDDVKSIMGGAYPILQNAYRFGELAEGTIARLPIKQHETFFKVLDFESLFLSRHEGEEHARLRRIASRAFTARRIEQLRDSIQRHVDDLIDEMFESPNPDMRRDLANRLPVRVIVDLIGVPQEDRDQIFEWSNAIARLFSLDEGSLAAADAAIDAFREYVGRTVDRVRRTGEGPELAKVMLESRDNEALTEDELVAMYLLILFGGSETTTNLLGNGFLALQRHRAQWDMLVADPSLVRPAIEEMLRYDSPHHYLPRVVAEDFELHGRQMKKGQTLIVIQASANRDPLHFDDPDTFDITRANKGDHLSLAYGPHFCLGAALARLEGEIMFGTLLRRFPDAQLLDFEPMYGGSAMLRAVESLPTDFGTPVA